MNEVVYPVILTYADNVIYITVPDFGTDEGVTYGENINETIKSAKEIITLLISDLEDENKELPMPSDIKEIKKTLRDNQEVIYINMWLPYEKSLIKINYKKKTLSIPAWLDMLAVQKNINFSQVLVKALKEELGIEK